MVELSGLWRRQVIHTFANHTQEAYLRVVQKFIQSMPISIKADNITSEHIERYLTGLFDNHLTASSVNNYLAALRSFFKWAEPVIGKNPAKSIAFWRQAPPKQRILTDKEYHQILNICSERDSKIITILAHTGLRSQELRDLRPENLSADRQFLRICGKGGCQRTIPLNQTAQMVINKAGFFHLLKSRYRRPCSLTVLCRKLGKRLGISPFGPHAFRHYFATWMLKEGCDLYTLKEILGHKHIETTEKYLHLLNDDLRGATDRLD